MSNQTPPTELDKVVDWSVVHGNLLLKHLHPLMLMPSGLLERNFVVLKGTAIKRNPTKQPVIVRYGVDFVYAKILHLFMPLIASGHNTESIVLLVKQALEGIEHGEPVQPESPESASQERDS